MSWMLPFSGREAKDIKVDHLGFDLYPITITQEGSEIVAKGRLSTFRRIPTTTNSGKPIEMRVSHKTIDYSVTIRDSLATVTGLAQDPGSTDNPFWPMGKFVGPPGKLVGKDLRFGPLQRVNQEDETAMLRLFNALSTKIVPTKKSRT